MRRDTGETPNASRETRDPDRAMDLAGVGPDAHSAQELGLAPEDVPKARRSVAEADRKAEARQERESGPADGEGGDDEPIGWTDAPESDERAETENASPPPGEVFHEPPPLDDALDPGAIDR